MSRLARRSGLHSAAAAAWSPLSIAWSHAYWTEGPEFLALALADAGAVSTWPDEMATGDMTQATAGAKPTYRSASALLGNRPVVEFDGTADVMTSASYTAMTGPTCVVAVARYRGALVPATVQNLFFLSSASDAPIEAAIDVDGTFDFWTSGAGGSGCPGPAIDNTKHLWRWLAKASAQDIWRDETDVGGVASGSTVRDITGTRLGAGPTRATPARFGAFDVAFLGLFDGELTAQNASDLHSWAQTLYGVT